MGEQRQEGGEKQGEKGEDEEIERQRMGGGIVDTHKQAEIYIE